MATERITCPYSSIYKIFEFDGLTKLGSMDAAGCFRMKSLHYALTHNRDVN